MEGRMSGVVTEPGAGLSGNPCPGGHLSRGGRLSGWECPIFKWVSAFGLSNNNKWDGESRWQQSARWRPKWLIGRRLTAQVDWLDARVNWDGRPHTMSVQTSLVLTQVTQVASIKPISQLRFDCDTTTTRLRRKIDVHFLLASNRVEWKQARAIRRSRIAVVS